MLLTGSAEFWRISGKCPEPYAAQVFTWDPKAIVEQGPGGNKRYAYDRVFAPGVGNEDVETPSVLSSFRADERRLCTSPRDG